MDTRPIGVFDSGFGGLTVLSSLCSVMPHESFIYIADTLHLPYGNKPSTDIIAYSIELTQYLLSHDVKAIVMACNTSSTISLPVIKNQFSVPFFGLVDAAVESVMQYQNIVGKDIHRLGLIGSKNTIASRAHENGLRTAGYAGEIFTQSCPLFVSLIEEGIFDENVWRAMIGYYLSPFLDKRIDCLLLAGTHYSVVLEYLQSFFDGSTQILDPNFRISREVADYLQKSETTNQTGAGSVELCVTGKVDSFRSAYPRFLRYEESRIRDIRHIDLTSGSSL